MNYSRNIPPQPSPSHIQQTPLDKFSALLWGVLKTITVEMFISSPHPANKPLNVRVIKRPCHLPEFSKGPLNVETAPISIKPKRMNAKKAKVK